MPVGCARAATPGTRANGGPDESKHVRVGEVGGDIGRKAFEVPPERARVGNHDVAGEPARRDLGEQVCQGPPPAINGRRVNAGPRSDDGHRQALRGALCDELLDGTVHRGAHPADRPPGRVWLGVVDMQTLSHRSLRLC